MSQIDFQVHKQPISFQPSGPQKVPFDGVHFSSDPIEGGVIQGSRRGSSPDASDALRLHLGQGAPAGVHAYREGFVGHPHIASRKFAHRITGNKAIATIENEPLWKQTVQQSFANAKKSGLDDSTAFATSINDGERALKNAGYDGLESTKHKGQVFLFGDVPTVPSAKPTQ
jgi:hypothetical protein